MNHALDPVLHGFVMAGAIYQKRRRNEMENENTEIKPTYEPPKIAVMDDAEVLKAFQMTAAQISAAGCWWDTVTLTH